jgi:hypothetical protein
MVCFGVRAQTHTHTHTHTNSHINYLFYSLLPRFIDYDPADEDADAPDEEEDGGALGVRTLTQVSDHGVCHVLNRQKCPMSSVLTFTFSLIIMLLGNRLLD